MKKLTILVISILAATPASAKYGKGGEGMGMYKKQKHPMYMMDKNQDGKITFEEFKSKHDIMRNKYDEKREERFEVLDRDADGQISKKEFLKGISAEERFKMLDEDSDGIVTKEELWQKRKEKKSKRKGGFKLNWGK
jgi:hypothetical protein